MRAVDLRREGSAPFRVPEEKKSSRPGAGNSVRWEENKQKKGEERTVLSTRLPRPNRAYRSCARNGRTKRRGTMSYGTQSGGRGGRAQRGPSTDRRGRISFVKGNTAGKKKKKDTQTTLTQHWPRQTGRGSPTGGFREQRRKGVAHGDGGSLM